MAVAIEVSLRACRLVAEAVLDEWCEVIQVQAISFWEAYRSASRTGRGRPLAVKERKVIRTSVKPCRSGLDRRKACSLFDLKL